MPTPLELAKTASTKATEAAADAAAVVRALEAAPEPPNPQPQPTPEPPKPPEPTSGTWNGYSASNPPDAAHPYYAATSPFNTPVGPSPLVLANSAAMVGYLLSHHNGPTATDPQNAWGHPIVFASTSDPLYAITLTAGTRIPAGTKVHCPVQAQPAPGSDGQLAIIQPDGTEVDLSVTKIDHANQTISAAYGSINTPGINGSGLEASPTASGFALGAGNIRAQELAAGPPPHAAFVVVGNCAPGHVWPATKGDGTDGSAPFSEGQRFYLEYSDAEIAALNAKPYQRFLTTMFAHMGFYVGDKGGGGFDLKFEQSLMYTAFGVPDPWVALAEKEGVSGLQFTFPAGIDWTRLRAIAAPPH